MRKNIAVKDECKDCLIYDTVCHKCGKPSVTPNRECASTPSDMIWCEGPGHTGSILLHMDCCNLVYVTSSDENSLVCDKCASVYVKSGKGKIIV